MKRGLVLEGGAMKGIYTAGVLDVFMEEGIEFDGCVGVSAGALFGVNFLSKQKGRVVRYNKKYNQDKNYIGLRPLLKTGNIIDTEYAYERVPRVLEPFDDEAFIGSQTPFYAVITNMETGQPEYPRLESVFGQMDTLRASGAMPFLSQPVEIGGRPYLDGAITDSIPYDFMFQKGYDHLVVILTKEAGYIKKPMPQRLAGLVYGKKYPLFAEKIRQRHNMYNRQMKRLGDLEREGRVQVIRPSQKPNVGRVEKDPGKIEALYQMGIKDGKAFCQGRGW